jgi:hypothetical protein
MYIQVFRTVAAMGRKMLRFVSDYHDAGHRLYGTCNYCRRSMALDLRHVMRRYGPMLTIEELRGRLRCHRCGRAGDVRVVLNSHDGR